MMFSNEISLTLHPGGVNFGYEQLELSKQCPEPPVRAYHKSCKFCQSCRHFSHVRPVQCFTKSCGVPFPGHGHRMNTVQSPCPTYHLLCKYAAHNADRRFIASQQAANIIPVTLATSYTPCPYSQIWTLMLSCPCSQVWTPMLFYLVYWRACPFQYF